MKKSIRFDIRTLRTRIVLAFASILISGQGIGYWLVDAASERNAQTQLDVELDAGQRVFERVLGKHRAQLAQVTTVIATDLRLRDALARQDIVRLDLLLDIHRLRLEATRLQLLDVDGRLVGRAGSRLEEAPIAVDRDLLATARSRDQATRIVVQDGRPWQLLVIPMRTPALAGWFVLAFEIDNRLALELQQLTELEVSFLHVGGGNTTVFASTFGEARRHSLEASLQSGARRSGGRMLRLDGTRFGTRLVRVDEAVDETVRRAAVSLPPATTGVYAVLQRSLDAKLADFAPLRQFLLGLFLSGVCLSLGIAAWITRGITRPLGVLEAGARRMRAGDYTAPILLHQRDELGDLADAFNDMREQIALREVEVLRLAYRDVPTDLPNRARFVDLLQSAIAGDWAAVAEPIPSTAPTARAVAEWSARRSMQTPGGSSRRDFALLLIDLDRFRLINDTLGHATGDDVLREVARRLRQAVPAQAVVARLGADEFGVLLPPGAAAQRIVRVILDLLRQPIVLHDQPLDATASVGIARYPDHGDDASTLLRRADVALRAAKLSADDYAVYDPTLDQGRQAPLSLLGELRRAVDAGELRVHYQPKVDLRVGRVTGVEALVRWQHPVRGLLAPGQFIPYAEQTGLVRQVTGWMLAQAIAQCGRWAAAGLALQVSINVSTRDLTDDGLPERVARLLDAHAVPPGRVCLEITESGMMEDAERSLRNLRALDALGVDLSVDDYGTGLSSLSYLRRLPVDELKIDRGFVMGMMEERDDQTIVRSTIELAHNLGLRVVAEGVETAEVMDVLAAAGCDIAQGYHVSRPLPADQLAGWLAGCPWPPAPAGSATRESPGLVVGV